MNHVHNYNHAVEIDGKTVKLCGACVRSIGGEPTIGKRRNSGAVPAKPRRKRSSGHRIGQVRTLAPRKNDWEGTTEVGPNDNKFLHNPENAGRFAAVQATDITVPGGTSVRYHCDLLDVGRSRSRMDTVPGWYPHK
jgi:hypothetical protein